MQTIEQTLEKLKKSKFRSGFNLNNQDKAYVLAKGYSVIQNHAIDFVRQKLAPAEPYHDGKQTPTHGHPVFKAMHGCACCCRGCLEKWYKVPKGQPLTQDQQNKIVDLLMAWIKKENEGVESN